MNFADEMKQRYLREGGDNTKITENLPADEKTRKYNEFMERACKLLDDGMKEVLDKEITEIALFVGYDEGVMSRFMGGKNLAFTMMSSIVDNLIESGMQPEHIYGNVLQMIEYALKKYG